MPQPLPPKPPYPNFPEQNADGVDLSIIRRNLQLSPTERVRRADKARRDFLRIREHAREIPRAKRP